MRTKALFAAILPIAFGLSACGSDPEPAEIDGSGFDTQADTSVAYPEAPLNARGTIDYQGSYSQRGSDGAGRTITLGANDGYTIRNADGTETSGTFNWYSDNSRILIQEDGENQVYAVADGYLYRLSDENAPLNGAPTSDTAYTRIDSPGG